MTGCAARPLTAMNGRGTTTGPEGPDRRDSRPHASVQEESSMPKKAGRNAAVKMAEAPARPAAERAEDARRAPFAPGTMQTLRVPMDAQLSPDGASVAFVVR